MMTNDLPKRVHQNRPSLILNIDNEYMTYLLMDEIKCKLVIDLKFIQSITSTAECRCPSVITSIAS
jgi:hypothetical protein